MFSKLKALLTRSGKTDHSYSQPSPTGSSRGIRSLSSDRQVIGSEEGSWSKFIELFHCRRLAELEKDFRTEREARLLLEGQATTQRGEIDRLMEMLAEALRNERRVYQMQVNVNMQGKFGFVPFPDAPQVPNDLYSPDRPSQIEPDYVNMRSLQAEATESFRRHSAEILKQRANG